MIKIGLLLCSYASENYIDQCLESWLKFDNVVISVTSCPFINFEEQDNHKNMEKLYDYQNKGKIDSIYTTYMPIKECEARNYPLQRLISLNCDIIVLVDVDEIWTVQEIQNLIDYINKTPQFCWYKVEYKNLIFNKNTYITGFDPARVFRVNYNNWNIDYELYQCIDDNDFNYLSKHGLIRDKWLPHTIIDIKICNPLHYSWLNNDRSRRKIEYQKRRNWNTSFNWNYEKNCIEFNEIYYKDKNKPILHKLNENK